MFGPIRSLLRKASALLCADRRTARSNRATLSLEGYEDRTVPAQFLPNGTGGVSYEIPGFDPEHIRVSSTSFVTLRIEVPNGLFPGLETFNVVGEIPVFPGFGDAKLIAEETDPLIDGVTGVLGVVTLDGVRPVDPQTSLLVMQYALATGFTGDRALPPPTGLAGGFQATVPDTGVVYTVPLVGVTSTGATENTITVGGVDFGDIGDGGVPPEDIGETAADDDLPFADPLDEGDPLDPLGLGIDIGPIGNGEDGETGGNPLDPLGTGNGSGLDDPWGLLG